MADETPTIGKREQGRQRALDGILFSRFGQRPCSGAEGALQALRSPKPPPVSNVKSTAPKKRGPRPPWRGRREEQGAAPAAARRWPAWIKISSAAAAAVLLWVTARSVMVERKRPAGGGGGKHTEGVADAGKGKRGTAPSMDDPNRELVRELSWTVAFAGKHPPPSGTGAPKGKGGADAPAIEGGGGSPPFLGGPSKGGGGKRGGPAFGAPKGDLRVGSPPGSSGGAGGSSKDDGAPLPSAMEEGRGEAGGELQAAKEACLRRLSFTLRIPVRLAGEYVLSALVPKEAGDGVMLLYVRGDALARVFVQPSPGPDEPSRPVEVGGRRLWVARKGGLLVTMEGGPADPIQRKAWVELFPAR